MTVRPKRRRGASLESAILEAAWTDLLESGYSKLTLEAVAKRAGTSRPVLYRRWPDRAHLAVAAIRHFVESHPLHAEDLGSLREDLMALFHASLNRGVFAIALAAMQMSDYYRETHSTPADLRKKILQNEEELLQAVLHRGVNRGEIDPAKLKPRVVSLVSDLLRHELLMTQEQVSDMVIAEVIEDIFLPLVHP